MKKLLPLLIVGIFVFSGFGIGAFTDDNILNNLQFQRNCENNIIVGPTTGNVGTEYPYNIITYEIDEVDVFVDWDDGQNTG